MSAQSFGCDFGTSSIKIYSRESDTIYCEKNMVAIEEKKGKTAYGNEAFDMHEKAPSNIEVLYPMSFGTVASITYMQQFLRSFLEERTKGSLKGAEFIVALPTDVQDRVFTTLIHGTGIKTKNVELIDKPVAAGLGLGLDVTQAQGVMLVDVGADTTEISILSLGGTVTSKLIKNGGNKIDEAISSAIRREYGYFIGNKTAGFPCAVVVTCMFYAAISGSSPATVSAVGAMTIPFLVNMGYETIFAAAIVTVAGGLGVIIPPSISYIVYSAAANASPSSLFTAGILPGILIGVSLMLYCYYYCKKHGEDKEKLLANYKEIRAKGFLPLLKESFWALLTPVIILGTIYSGICSPTESAVISVFYGLFVCMFIYKTIKVRDLGRVFMEGAKTYVNILFVIAAATAFARCLTMLRYPQTISESVLALSDNRVVILLIMNAIMLVSGMNIDNLPTILILTPIMVPIATAVGVDPVHFGIIMTCNLAIGMVTPPMGINLFVAAGMTKIPMLKLARACVPFLIAFFISLMIITFVPGLSMALPGLIG